MSINWGNVIAYYKFSDSSGSTIAYDGSNNTYNGILTGGTVIFGVTNNYVNTRTCVEFNGTGYFRIPDTTINNLSSGSISVWFYFTDITKKYTIISKQHDGSNTYAVLSIGYNASSGGGYKPGTNGIVYWHAKNGINNIQSSGALTVNTWNFITVSFTSANCIMYINGVSSGSNDGNYSIPNVPTVTLTSIGRWANTGLGSNNNCRMADLAIWNTNLTQADVTFLYSTKPEPFVSLSTNYLIKINDIYTDLSTIYYGFTGTTGMVNNTNFIVNVNNINKDLSELFQPWDGIKPKANNTTVSVDSPWLQRATPQNWSSIASSSDGTKIAACTDPGYIYTSTDSGETWTQQTASGSRVWTSIASSSDGTKLVACNDAPGYIYTSTDSGVTWTERITSGSRAWYSVTSTSAGSILFACAYSSGGYGTYGSSDSGANWALIAGNSVANNFAVATGGIGNKLLLVRDLSGFWLCTNPITSPVWTFIVNNGDGYTTSSYGAVAISPSENVLAFGSRSGTSTIGNSNSIYISINGGTTFQNFTNTPAFTGWSSLCIPNDTTIYGAPFGPQNINGLEGFSYIWKGTFTGSVGNNTWTFTQIINAGSKIWYRITSSSNGNAIYAASRSIAGTGLTGPSSGYVYKNTIGNIDLSQMFNPNEIFSSYKNITSNVGSTSHWSGGVAISTTGQYAVVGTYGTSNANTAVYYTSNYGVTWAKSTITFTGNLNVLDIQMSSDGSKCYFINAAITATFDVYFSIDYGATFAKKGNGIAANANVPYMAMSDDGNTVIGIKISAAIAYVTTNFSNASPTWTSNTITGAPNSCRVVAANSTCSTLYVTSGSGVYKSTNTGTTWSTVSSGLPAASNWNGISMSKDATIVVCGQNTSGSVYVSTNSGTSFSQITTTVPTNLSWVSVAVSNTGKFIAVGSTSSSSSTIYISYNLGVSWSAYIPTGSSGYQSDSIAIQNKLLIAKYNLNSNVVGGVGAVFMSTY